MRIVLQDIQSGLFYRGSNEWTDASDDAIVFHTSAQALAEALRLENSGIIILMRFIRKGQPDACVPANDRPKKLLRREIY